MEKQTKPKPLGAPMAKMILVVAIIVFLGAVLGVAGYLAKKSKTESCIPPTTQKQESIHDIDLDTGDSLVIEEYPVNENVVISYSCQPFDTVAEKLPQEILEKRRKWRKLFSREETIEHINRELKPLGYKLLQEDSDFESYSFYKGRDLVEERLHDIHEFSMDTKKTRFVFSASKWFVTFPENDLVFINGDMHTREEWGFNPVWINDELWRIKGVGNIGHTEMYFIVNDFIDKPILDEILQKTTTSWVKGEIQGKEYSYLKYNLPELPPQVIYRFFVPITAGCGPIIKFWAYEKGWVLEFDGDIIINGKSTAEENYVSMSKRNYAMLYEFCLIKDKPFYFLAYPDMDQTGEWPPYLKNLKISYDGKVLPAWYDEIWVGTLGGGECGVCSYTWRNESMIWFFARRGEQYYYVETGVYK